MSPGSQVQACISILEAYQSDKGPFDQYLNYYLSHHHYMGSSDRRFIQELVFEVLRWYPALEQIFSFCLKAFNFRLAVLMYLKYFKEYSIERLSGLNENSPYSIAPLNEEELYFLQSSFILTEASQVALPEWLYELFMQGLNPPSALELKFLNQSASVDLRVNLMRISRKKLIKYLDEKGIEATPLSHSPLGVRLKKRVRLRDEGLFAIQDEGSQLLAIMINAAAEEKILDYCAGGGGKTLAMADISQDLAHIQAYDIRPSSLNNLRKRSAAAGFQSIHCIIQESLKDKKNFFDKVIVDAPCSGTGMLRRAPERKLWLTPSKIEEYCRSQKEILLESAASVRPGGKLYYLTCSLLECENSGQIKQFLEHNKLFKTLQLSKDFNPIDPQFVSFDPWGVKLSPWQTGTDGFYCSVLQKIA